jgi:uncharacterized protein YcsI (UPF0317 family)
MTTHDWQKNPKQFRQKVRSGEWADSTPNVCIDYVQANLVILPLEYAFDFTLFCLRNPKPCPILEIMEAGQYRTQYLSQDADIRSDVPKYMIYKEGQLIEERTDIFNYWQDDLVTFLIGCSYTFEEALVRAGVPLANYTAGKDVSVYISNIQLNPAGIFKGPMVVSMRAVSPVLISRAVQVTSRFPKTHGAPVHIGPGEGIGIKDIHTVDFGDPPIINEGEVEVYWGCGVTPQMAALESKVPFMITHKACHMFVSDLKIEEVAES